MGGSLFFRYEYSYDAAGRVEERGVQEDGAVIIRRFP
jgi:YD repeat-containing protein